jgi:hypothetical protein
MAITPLNLPTLVGGVTTGYPQYIRSLNNKIDELARLMNISPLNLIAQLGAGSPSGDFNLTVAKVNELIGNYNGGTTAPAPIAQPIAPDFSGFDDVNNTVSVSHQTLPVTELLYDFAGDTGIPVPLNNVISVGNKAGQVSAYARTSGTRPEGVRRNSQPFTVASAPNSAPTITLSSPQAGQTLAVGDPVVLNANPQDADGAADIKRVDFFVNGEKFGETTGAPHTVQRNLLAGTNSYTAQVYDMAGASKLSNAVVVTGAASGAGDSPALIVISGQSNALGIGEVNEIAGTQMQSYNLLRTFQRVKIWNNNRWENLQVPVNNRANPNKFGFELGIAQRWEELHPSATLYIVKQAHSGDPIEKWQPGNVAGYLDELISLIKTARASLPNQAIPTIGMLWMQGESNPDDTSYATKLTDFRNNLVNAVALPASSIFSVGKVRKFETVRQQQELYVSQNLTFARIVDTTNYLVNGDDLHYSAKGLFLGGYTDFYNSLFGTNSTYPFLMAYDSPLVITGTQTQIENRSLLWKYSGSNGIGAGNFTTYNNNRESGFDGFTYTLAPGDEATIEITGTGFTLIHARYEGLVTAYEVWIDGRKRGAVGHYPAVGLAVRYSSPVLEPGKHIVKLISRGFLLVDALIADTAHKQIPVEGEAPADSPTILANDVRLKYEGTWNTITVNAGWSAGTVFTTTPGSYFEFPFNGNKLELYGTGQLYNQAFDLYIDNELVDSVLLPGDGSQANKIIYTRTVTAGQHTARFQFRTGQYLIMDRVVIS